MLTLKPYPQYKDSGLPWLGEVPAHWECKRTKALVKNVNQQTDHKLPDEIYVALEHVEAWTGRFRPANEDVEFGSQVKRFKLGDILFGKLRPYLAKVTIPSEPGVCVGEFLVLRTLENMVTPAFLECVLRSKPVIDVINSSTFGARMPRADWDFIGNLRLALPTRKEQEQIAVFLNHFDRRINRLIRAKQRMIALLKEQKQAIIQQAVTRGLDPNVRLKPSGIDWLGDIPEHWEIVRSKRLFSMRQELALPDDQQLSATQAFGVIPQSDFEEKVGRRVVKISMHLERRRHVEVDDFVISMRSFQGGLERAWASGAIRSSYVVLKPEPGVDIGYFAYLFKSYRYIRALQATADFIRDGQDLNFGNFCRVDLPLIPLHEQRAIAEFIAKLTDDIDKSYSRLQKEISLLQEYRTRLIADVVTGKLDVRGVELPAEDETEPLEDLDFLEDADVGELDGYQEAADDDH